MHVLKIISSTTRPGRKGPLVASWVENKVRKFGHFEPQIIDLGELNLPLMDEPNHPSKREYKRNHTKQWSATIDGTDAFIFVTGEYNYSYPAPLKNALDYLSREWEGKAAGIVSYGGISGGTRAWNRLKGDLSSYGMSPVPEGVHFPFFEKHLKEGTFDPAGLGDKSMEALLNSLLSLSDALKTLRSSIS